MLKLLERTDLTAEEKLMAAIFGEESDPGQPFCVKEIGETTLECWIQEEIFETFLKEREKQVLSLRFGLKDGRARTLLEIGREIGTTREVPRKIEAKSLRKLRHPSSSCSLRLFLISSDLTPEEKAKILEEFKIRFAEIREERLEIKRRIAEDRALWGILQKSSFSRSGYCFYRIREAGISLSNLKTLSEEEVVRKLDIRIKVPTKTEQCLRELWRIVNTS